MTWMTTLFLSAVFVPLFHLLLSSWFPLVFMHMKWEKREYYQKKKETSLTSLLLLSLRLWTKYISPPLQFSFVLSILGTNDVSELSCICE